MSVHYFNLWKVLVLFYVLSDLETNLTLNGFSDQLFKFFLAKLNLLLFHEVASFVTKYFINSLGKVFVQKIIISFIF